MPTPNPTPPKHPERHPAPDPEPAEAPVGRRGAPDRRGTASDRGAVEVVLLVAPTAVALLLLLVILPARDGGKARDAARDTYFELESLSRTARWEIDGEIRSAQTVLDSDLYSFRSWLWSVRSDLGSLAYSVEAGARPRVRELEDAIDARRDELRGLRSSTDVRFDQLLAGVEERLSGLEDAAGAALDDHWDESSRRSSRDVLIVMVWMFAMFAAVLAFWLVGLWGSWRGRRDLSGAGGT